MNGLGNVGQVDVAVSGGACAMSLSPLVFSASGTYTLAVDPTTNAIVDYSGTSITEAMKDDNSDAAVPNNFYYLPNPNNSQEQLSIEYLADNTTYYVGYQFQQQSGTAHAQFRPIFWQVGKTFADRNIDHGDWVSLIDSSQKYTSSVTWSGGEFTSGTKLSITLSPNPAT